MVKKILPILLATLILTGCAPADDQPEESFRQISMDDAIALMADETGYIILDVRTVGEYKEKHIPGAINIPNETIGTEEPELLPDKEQLILVYCRSGNRSKQAAAKLASQGYTNIVEFGGIIDWPRDTVSELDSE